jgi:hypothetical protein
MCLRHGGELPRSIEPHGVVPQRSEVAEIATGSTTEIKDRVGWVTLYGIEECRIILADIVVSRTVPEGSGEPIVKRDRRLAEAADLFRVMWFSCAPHQNRPPISRNRVPALAPGNGAGSARLPDTVTEPQLLQEYGIAMEFAGFHPRALGAVLYLTPEPPPIPSAHERPDAVISMGGPAPLTYLPNNAIAARADLAARMGGIMKIGNGRWVAANDIDWFLPPEFDEHDRGRVEATGIG